MVSLNGSSSRVEDSQGEETNAIGCDHWVRGGED